MVMDFSAEEAGMDLMESLMMPGTHYEAKQGPLGLFHNKPFNAQRNRLASVSTGVVQ